VVVDSEATGCLGGILYGLIKDLKFGRSKNKPFTAERKKVLERRSKDKQNRRKK
jgi:hypothetical protein